MQYDHTKTKTKENIPLHELQLYYFILYVYNIRIINIESKKC